MSQCDNQQLQKSARKKPNQWGAFREQPKRNNGNTIFRVGLTVHAAVPRCVACTVPVQHRPWLHMHAVHSNWIYVIGPATGRGTAARRTAAHVQRLQARPAAPMRSGSPAVH